MEKFTPNSEAECLKCHGTSVEETGNNDFPCSCPAGTTALFNVTGVEGPVTGYEVNRFLLNTSPEPIDKSFGTISADSLPSRQET